MILTADYKPVRLAPRGVHDFSGWITPSGEFLKHLGSHAGTLREHGIPFTADRAVDEGYTWMNHVGSIVYIETLFSNFDKIKRILNDLLDYKYVKEVSFELFNEKRKMVKWRTFDFTHGVLE